MTPALLSDDPSPFREWLESHAEGSVVGRATDGCGCPLALWIQSLGLAEAKVSCGRYGTPDGLRMVLPAWAAAFYVRVDLRAHDERGDRQAPVSREEALKVLSEVTR